MCVRAGWGLADCAESILLSYSILSSFMWNLRLYSPEQDHRCHSHMRFTTAHLCRRGRDGADMPMKDFCSPDLT
jgi:hypothetical protein